MKIVTIIPARMNSSRFPGKPLKKIGKFTMIEHCYNRSKLAKKVDLTYVATCDSKIYEHCLKKKINVVMTSKKHNRASDRVAEALLKIEKKLNKVFDVIMMLQGDEPMITPLMLDKLIEKFVKSKTGVANLICKITKKEEILDSNEIKVVKNLSNNALYFSRNYIPYCIKGINKTTIYKQICAIPFSRKMLAKFNKLSETPLEKSESVDMLRFIENKINVHLVETNSLTYSVDNKYDLKKVIKLMRKDKYVKRYNQ